MIRETITLNQKEQHRVHILTRLQGGILRAAEAASLLGLSVRHLRRLLARFRRHGAAAVSHGNRGRPSHRRLTAAVRAQVLTLARTTYAGVNDHHLTELLRLHHGICLSRPTVQRLLRGAGLPSPRRRRPPRHRRRRERMPQTGLLVQMDGSHHPWLEDRGPRLVLLAAIDDATGRVLAAVFRLEEDAHGYFLLLGQLIRRYGLPAAVYTDRHGIFHRDPRTPPTLSEQLAGRLASTQVGRALQELGIRWIGARSPKPRAGSNASLAPSRIGSWWNCAWPRLARSRRPNACSTVFSRATMLASPRPPRTPRPRGALPLRAQRSTASAASSPRAPSGTTTPSHSTASSSNSTPTLRGTATLAPASRSTRTSTVHSPSTIAVTASARRASQPTNSPLGALRSDSLRASRPEIPLAPHRADHLHMRRTVPPSIIPGAGRRPPRHDAGSSKPRRMTFSRSR